jgi:hypothetical protein
MQIADLQAANIKIKHANGVELETERLRHKEPLKAQLLEADAVKEQKRIDAAKAKRLADIEKEVNDTFAELVIPE